MVSVGLDSKVVVWSGSTFEKLKTLSNHQSHVKGITFDPANKYFATASDDRTIKVFRFTPPNPNSTAQDQIHNFLIETTISAPFTRSPLTTYFRRCSWAPDGLHIACPNAVNGPVSCIAVVNRGTWDCDINFIGHEGPVEVCSFSPRLYTREFEEPPDDGSKAGQTEDHALMVACAGQDKSLTVWSTGRTRPVIVAYDLTLKSISDVAWNPDGNGLFVTSLDGSITSVTFDAGDLGFVLDLASNEEALSRFGAGRKGGGLIDGATALQLEEQSKAGEITRVEGRMGELMGDGQSKSDKQTAPAALLSEVAKQGDAETTSGAEARANAQLNRDSQPEQNTEKPPQDNHAARLERLKQRVTYTKDGKKRIAPLLISGANGRSETSLPEAQLLTGLVKDKSTNQESSGQILDLSRPYDKLPEGGLEALLLGNKRGFAIPEGQDESQVEHHVARLSRDGAIPILTNGVDGLAPPSKTSAETTIMPTPEFIRPAVVNPILAVSQVRLSTPKVRGQLVHKVDNGSGMDVLSRHDSPKQSLCLLLTIWVSYRCSTRSAQLGRSGARPMAGAYAGEDYGHKASPDTLAGLSAENSSARNGNSAILCSSLRGWQHLRLDSSWSTTSQSTHRRSSAGTLRLEWQVAALHNSSRLVLCVGYRDVFITSSARLSCTHSKHCFTSSEEQRCPAIKSAVCNLWATKFSRQNDCHSQQWRWIHVRSVNVCVAAPIGGLVGCWEPVLECY